MSSETPKDSYSVMQAKRKVKTESGIPRYYTANNTTRPVISTAASPDLRKILLDIGTKDMSLLARKAMEHQFAIYADHLASIGEAKFTKTLPTLVDITAQKVSLSTNTSADFLSGLADIPDALLKEHVWTWHFLPYTSFLATLSKINSRQSEKKRRKLTDATAESDPLNTVDEWILSNERFIRDNGGTDWKKGLVSLEDASVVFPESTLNKSARKISRPLSLPGFKVLDGLLASSISIQPSSSSFSLKFNHLTDGLLKGLDWTNVFVAGGIVLGALTDLGNKAGKSSTKVESNQWQSSDIDLYLYGLPPRQANEKVSSIFQTYRSNLPDGVEPLVVRNSKTITFFAKHPLRRVQIVLKMLPDPRAVLLNFDLDVCSIGWDGTTVWMLPRAARALETGYSVFTMDLIQGHYLGERRATQEKRVFKYANKGYGIRILPSYVASLKASAEKIAEIALDEDLYALDIEAIATKARNYTAVVVAENVRGYRGVIEVPTLPHLALENNGQLSAEPQSRSILSGFNIFMRHVALWEMERQGKVIIDVEKWASETYEQCHETVLSYDDTPQYVWDESFNLDDFKHQMDKHNLRQIEQWVESREQGEYEAESTKRDPTRGHGRMPSNPQPEFNIPPMDIKGPEFKSAQRVSYGETVNSVLTKTHDIVIPLLLPANFAAYANDIVRAAMKDRGLPVQSILTHARPNQTALVVDKDSTDTTEGLFLWRITKDIMWQQVDRRIDETFEALFAFHRVNDRLYDRRMSPVRLVTELSRRAIRNSVEDEFHAFARWIGRRPVFDNRGFNGYIGEEDMEEAFQNLIL